MNTLQRYAIDHALATADDGAGRQGLLGRDHFRVLAGGWQVALSVNK